MLQLAENIRLVRVSMKLTQEDFAEKFNSTKGKIYTYEKGKANPDRLLVKEIAEFAGVTADDLQNKKLKRQDLNFTAVNYSTRPPKGKQEEAQKNQNDSEAILVYKELVKQLQETVKQLQEQVKQQKELIDKLLQKS